MNKETIMNTYAKEQGFFDWNDLMNEFVIRHMDNKNCEESFRWINSHLNKVTDLIQEELKKKIADRFNGGFERCRIIDTETL